MKIINVLEHRLSEVRRVLEKKWREQANGTVEKYTASVQQIDRTLRDKGEKEWKEV